VRVAASAGRAALRGRGLAVRVTPRATGPIVVELRLGARRQGRARTRSTTGSTTTLRLRTSVRPGRYTISVKAARASTVRRSLIVR